MYYNNKYDTALFMKAVEDSFEQRVRMCIPVIFKNCRFSNICCQALELQYFNFVECVFDDCQFTGCDMHNTRFSECIIEDCEFLKVQLTGSDFVWNKVKDISFKRSYLDGVNFARTEFLGKTSFEDCFFSIDTTFFNLQCPQEGEYIGFKKCGRCIVKLLIPADAKRSSATSRKCRASKAKVLSIETTYGDAYLDEVPSDYDENFIYRVGETVEVLDFDMNRWNECAPGIHHFITREEAAQYES